MTREGAGGRAARRDPAEELSPEGSNDSRNVADSAAAFQDPLPFIKTYTAERLADAPLRSCSLAARGLEIELACHMARGEKHGYLLIGGLPPSVATIASLAAAAPEQVQNALDELLRVRVLCRDAEGVLFSPGVLKAQEDRTRNANNGRRGGNPNLRSRSARVEDSLDMPGDESVANPPVNPLDKPRARARTQASEFRDQSSENREEKSSRARVARAQTWEEVLSRAEFSTLKADPAFTTAWTEWIEHCGSAKKAKVPSGIQATKMFRAAVRYGVPRYVEAIDLAIVNNYAGVNPSWVKPDRGPPAPKATAVPSSAELDAARRAIRSTDPDVQAEGRGWIKSWQITEEELFGGAA